ncbi:MAG: branched-chain amino acid ABC transporter permease [Candidatus Dormibacteraeota bacterium]|uniref:Branched-chain amino acid ABC transporter permease n=1 Tax=Candidatus Dormiibacter inghamiae TaxID=3127013 RepID=A0A934KCC3_9BACT|nr:branched-chain amino acid ABC transporter permease [Candidatus Dormibacteraeota bacterium]MBJ7606294.1 branched-chain amino acid ABC transporter permease [Candidatus Dormibacteraeota bacterium]
MSVLAQSVGFGLITASVLALAAVGLSLQFGVTNYINFAYGEFLTIGAYLAWTLSHSLHLNVYLSLVVATLIMGVFALLLNRLLLRPFTKKGVPLLFLLVVTFGLSLFLSNLTLAIWGPDFQSLDLPREVPHAFGPFLFTTSQLTIIGIAAVAMGALHILLTRTEIGKAMRAMSDSVDLAQISGIDTDRITSFTWLLSGCLAGLAGIVLAINITSFQPNFGGEFLFVIFAAVILGGVGSPYGAMLGALVIGLATEMSAVLINSAYKNDVAFALLILTLLLRPQGIIRMAGKAA